jgi:hypothetical protein
MLARQREEARKSREELNEIFAGFPSNDNAPTERQARELAELDAALADLEPVPAVRKKSKKKVRRTKTADHAFARITRVSGTKRVVYEKDEDGRTVRRLHPTSSLPSSTPLPKPDKVPPLYRDTTDDGKIIWANRVLYAKGNAITWTLNLAPEIGRKVANDNQPGTWLAARIGYYLVKEVGKQRAKAIMKELFFSVGAASITKRLHVHGVATIEEHEEEPFERALDLAGGQWTAPLGDHGDPVDLTREWSPDGWSRYVFEHIPQARRILKGNPVYIPNQLRSRAKALHNRERAKLLAA